jgi:hypothetical protein
LEAEMLTLAPDCNLIARPGFLVVGEMENDELEEWRENHPEFLQWDADWFAKKFVEPRSLVADNSSSFGHGGEVLLFRTRESAEAYGKRDAALASGLRRIEEVLYVTQPGEDELADGAVAGPSRWSTRRAQRSMCRLF